MKKLKENKLKKDFYLECENYIKREGCEELLDYLSMNDFFEAPASTSFHDSTDYGLVVHSLAVFDIAKQLNETFELDINMESVAICALFHDVCKINFYIKEMRNKKIGGKWEEIETWVVKDQLPMGHGEKSVFIINKFMKLKDEEALAIRWHLGGFDPAIYFGYPYGHSNKQAFRENQLVALIAMADLGAAYLIN